MRIKRRTSRGSNTLTKLKKPVICRKVFIIALLFGLVIGVVSNLWVYFLFIVFQGRLPFTQFQSFMNILQIVKDFLPSIVMFFVFYRLGKNIDIKKAYVGVSASLIIGFAPGLFLGWLSSVFIMSVEFWWYNLGDQLYKDALAGVSCVTRQFFLGFTAIALAYFRTEKEQRRE